MPSRPEGGRHELGQNVLVDAAIIHAFTSLVPAGTARVVELAAGEGALTLPLARRATTVTAVEIDPGASALLRRRVPCNVVVVRDDILRFPLPPHRHTVVSNLPFHLTTAMLRRLLAARHWETAHLLAQWEVARRRAGVGGATMLTAMWWPWYAYRLHRRVPASAFRPMPSVDGGIFSIIRRTVPLVSDRHGYQRLVQRVFTGRGHDLEDTLLRTGLLHPEHVREWLRRQPLPPKALPKHLTADQWAALWERRMHATASTRRDRGRVPRSRPSRRQT
jgi:23S rRNA (adenine-N6)-dimethyltransferase